jgi:hypothetical protein
MWSRCVISVFAIAATATGAAAQATGNPSFLAPVAPFTESEMGVVVSMFSPSGVAYEGVYRYRDPEGAADLTARGGAFEHTGTTQRSMLLGLELRKQLTQPGDRFPLDMAFIAGIGGRVREEAAAFMVPIALSLGKRWHIGESLRLTPYVQPTVIVRYGTAVRSETLGALGMGTDISLDGFLDLRVNLGVGAVSGMAVSAVLIR